MTKYNFQIKINIQCSNHKHFRIIIEMNLKWAPGLDDVMMVIGNNLARAFGRVDAMSIIRFRTAVKDVMDIE
jgi:hypothetical protein